MIFTTDLRRNTNMVERIQVQHTEKRGKNEKYFVDEVKCSKSGEMQAAQRCKSCKHCRIYLGTYVKCTYADDKKRKEFKTVTIV